MSTENLVLELIDKFRLGEWATFIIVTSLLWKFVVSSLVQAWYKNKLDLQKQEVANTLQLQKEVALKQAEFEKVKLERVLPLLEEFNATIGEHEMMFATYIDQIANKGSLPADFEEKRISIDLRIIETISALSIYLPNDFLRLVKKLRLVISCSWYEPETVYRVLSDLTKVRAVLGAAKDLYSDMVDCFYSMCNRYLGISAEETAYPEILEEHKLDSNIKTTKMDPVNQLAWKYLLLHEYYGSNELFDAQQEVKDM